MLVPIESPYANSYTSLVDSIGLCCIDRHYGTLGVAGSVSFNHTRRPVFSTDQSKQMIRTKTRYEARWSTRYVAFICWDRLTSTSKFDGLISKG